MIVVPKSICLGKVPIRLRAAVVSLRRDEGPLRSHELRRDKTEQNRERYPEPEQSSVRGKNKNDLAK